MLRLHAAKFRLRTKLSNCKYENMSSNSSSIPSGPIETFSIKTTLFSLEFEIIFLNPTLFWDCNFWTYTYERKIKASLIIKLFNSHILNVYCLNTHRAMQYLAESRPVSQRQMGRRRGRLVTKQAFYVTKFNPFFLRPSSICPPWTLRILRVLALCSQLREII